MKKIKRYDLYDYFGKKLGRDLFYKSTILYKAGTRLDETVIKDIMTYPKDYVFSIFVEDGSDSTMQDVIVDEMWDKVKEEIDFIMNRYSHPAKENDKKLVTDIIYLLLEQKLEDQFYRHYVEDLALSDWNLFKHVVRVSVISTLLAIKAGLPKIMIECICIGGVIHDIGRLDLEQFYPEMHGDLTKYDIKNFQLFKSHPIVGYSKIIDNLRVPAEAKKIVLMHNVWDNIEASYNDIKKEYMSFPIQYNGTKLTNKMKDIGVDIVHVANLYDKLINNDIRYDLINHIDPEIFAIKFIKHNEDIMFSKAAAKLLYDYISPFSLGEKVLLNNAREAVVVTHTSNIMTPIVNILDENRHVDLSRSDLYIIGVYRDNKLLEYNEKDVIKFEQYIKDNYNV